MELAALAELYPHRVVGGLGHGMPGWMRQVGAAPRSPLTALRERLEAVRALLAGQTVSANGDYVHLDAVKLDHPPETPPPVLAGVRGPKSLELAAAAPTASSWPGRSPPPTSSMPPTLSPRDGAKRPVRARENSWWALR